MTSPPPRLGPLWSLPPEILHQILSECDGVSVAQFSATCRSANLFAHSPALFKALFLNDFDPPPEQVKHSYPYSAAVKARTSTALRLKHYVGRRPLRSHGYGNDEKDLIVNSLIAVALGRPAGRQTSLNERWLGRVCEGVALGSVCALAEAHEVRSQSPSTSSQLASRLVALRASDAELDHAARTRAREIVYDTANCNRSTAWGPFCRFDRQHRAGLSTDWRVVGAIAEVMGANLEEEMRMGWGGGEHERPRGWESTRAGEVREGERDWAGVEDGIWRGTYSFLDYRSWDHFNHHRSFGIPSLASEEEAVGQCMELKFTLVDKPDRYDPAFERFDALTHWDDEDTSDDENDGDFLSSDESSDEEMLSSEESPSSAEESSEIDSDDVERISIEQDINGSPDTSFASSVPHDSPPFAKLSLATPVEQPAPASQSTKAEDPTTPPLYFRGEYIGGASALIPGRSIRGTVSKTEDGEVHWDMTIAYSGADQWRLSGVQIGGPKSAYGIVGFWSTADHTPDGPHGPWSYWPERAAA